MFRTAHVRYPVCQDIEIGAGRDTDSAFPRAPAAGSAHRPTSTFEKRGVYRRIQSLRETGKLPVAGWPPNWPMADYHWDAPPLSRGAHRDRNGAARDRPVRADLVPGWLRMAEGRHGAAGRQRDAMNNGSMRPEWVIRQGFACVWVQAWSADEAVETAAKHLGTWGALEGRAACGANLRRMGTGSCAARFAACTRTRKRSRPPKAKARLVAL